MDRTIVCPICKNNNCEFILSRGKMPIIQNIVCKTEESAESLIKEKMEIFYCNNCEHIFNGNTKRYEQYNVLYDNSQICSEYFQRYMESIVEYILRKISLSEKTVLEIGCGKGDFIYLISKQSKCRFIGFDPSLEKEIKNENISLYNKIFDMRDVENLNESVDLVILRHILEHMMYPHEILKDVHKTLKKNGYIYIEVPSCEYILKNYSLFDIAYEHYNYFNINSLSYMLSKHNMKVVDYFYGFDNQYIGILAMKNGESNYITAHKKNNVKIEVNAFKENIAMIERNIINFIKLESQRKKTAFWGAGAKGMMSCNLFDSEKKYIECVVDIKEERSGTYIAGTGHIIISPYEMTEKNIESVIVVNSNYYDEVVEIVKSINENIIVYALNDIIKAILIKNEKGKK